jgi:carbon storage regulator CsrA
MLVLSRKLNETIVIDGAIEITVVRIDHKQIRLAIKAPDQVKIMRSELITGSSYCGADSQSESSSRSLTESPLNR